MPLSLVVKVWFHLIKIFKLKLKKEITVEELRQGPPQILERLRLELLVGIWALPVKARDPTIEFRPHSS
jgi:hypothetical protein